MREKDQYWANNPLAEAKEVQGLGGEGLALRQMARRSRTLFVTLVVVSQASFWSVFCWFLLAGAGFRIPCAELIWTRM